MDVIPAFDEAGVLPPGEHSSTWEEFVDRFGWNEVRRDSIEGLKAGLHLLAAAGCRQVWVNGSFVTAKETPNDFDASWDMDGVDLVRLDPILLDMARGRAAQRHGSAGSSYRTLWKQRVA